MVINNKFWAVIAGMLGWACLQLQAIDQVLVEAENFKDKGGWVVDQQFMDTMGSSYLLAHGMGKPVADAKTSVTFPSTGSYTMWVRTKNWKPGNWEAPGRFKVVLNGNPVETIFGTIPAWTWQKGGNVEIRVTSCEIALKDLTGFDGRCDALFFTKDATFLPPNDLKSMRTWRDVLLGTPAVPKITESVDLVVVGGGIAGCAASLAAEKQGLTVALIHDRPLLGGCASSEVRVHTIGISGKGEALLQGIYSKHWANGSAESIPDTLKRHKTLDAAKGVKQFLGWRAYGTVMDGKRILAVDARHIETGETRRFKAPVFVDSTGDGWIGFWAGAEYRYGREPADQHNEAWDKYGDFWSPKKADNRVMGTSLLWNTKKDGEASTFPLTPWAMDIAKDRTTINGEWYWEYSADHINQIDDAEAIRDHLLCAIYGTFRNVKRNAKNANISLAFVGYVGGKRESRRLMGDYIFTMQDAVSGTNFVDSVAEETRELDVHVQKAYYKSEPYDYLSHALFMKTPTYYIPFRSLYSKNIPNLMMAGRCFSCSHVGLGGPRVMKTTGQMGIATGTAAALCKKYKTDPRGIYEKHIDELRALIGY
ncbi:MAG: FAD-dependent oxidoreductase [bacterium]